MGFLEITLGLVLLLIAVFLVVWFVIVLIVRGTRCLIQVNRLRRKLEQAPQQVRDTAEQIETYLDKHAPTEELPFDQPPIAQQDSDEPTQDTGYI